MVRIRQNNFPVSLSLHETLSLGIDGSYSAGLVLKDETFSEYSPPVILHKNKGSSTVVQKKARLGRKIQVRYIDNHSNSCSTIVLGSV